MIFLRKKKQIYTLSDVILPFFVWPNFPLIVYNIWKHTVWDYAMLKTVLILDDMNTSIQPQNLTNPEIEI